MDHATSLTQLKTIVRKEVVRFHRIWIQALIPPIITTTLYFIIFGHLIGRFIPDIKGYSYMAYIIPGLVMMAITSNAYVNVVSSFFSAKFQRSIEELLVSPTSEHWIVLGYTLGGVARGVGVGILVLIIAELFVPTRIEHPILMAYVVVTSAALFSLGGFINAIFAKKFDDVSVVPTFVLQPLTYLGGVFYSIALLPHFWQKVSQLNPIFYIVNAFRYGMLGVMDASITSALVVISLLVVLLYLVAYWLLRQGTGLRH